MIQHMKIVEPFLFKDLIVSSLNLLEVVNELCIVSVKDRKAEVKYMTHILSSVLQIIVNYLNILGRYM